MPNSWEQSTPQGLKSQKEKSGRPTMFSSNMLNCNLTTHYKESFEAKNSMFKKNTQTRQQGRKPSSRIRFTSNSSISLPVVDLIFYVNSSGRSNTKEAKILQDQIHQSHRTHDRIPNKSQWSLGGIPNQVDHMTWQTKPNTQRK